MIFEDELDLPFISFPYPESFFVITVCTCTVVVVPDAVVVILALAAAFSINRIFSFSTDKTFGNEKNGIDTKINKNPLSKKPPHHIPTHL